VVGVDIDRKVRPTIQADYSCLPFRTGFTPLLVLAGPDCRFFSVAALWKHWNKDGTPKPETVAQIEKMRALKQEVKRMGAMFGLLEQPRCMSRRPEVLGAPDFTIFQSDFGREHKKPTDFWQIGEKELPFPKIEQHRVWNPAPRGSLGFSNSDRSPRLRAKWPLGLSRTILRAVLGVYPHLDKSNSKDNHD
jgi:hypothetical protein